MAACAGFFECFFFVAGLGKSVGFFLVLDMSHDIVVSIDILGGGNSNIFNFHRYLGK